MAGRLLRSISPAEFRQSFIACKPPPGFSHTLLVGNSGGPDSTCLLFLLHRLLNETHNERDFPQRIASFTVDHGLQESSAEMAERAGRLPQALGISHLVNKLPWGLSGNPQKPGPNEPIETVARAMRYLVFFSAMKRRNNNVIALGHHEDDQLETMFMRLGWGSGPHGLAAMRSCRRWGMGERERNYGLQGLNHWVVRPLLSFSKDRILATCDEHKLEYVQDSTNFQPQLTARNAIRHILTLEDKSTVNAELERLKKEMSPPLYEYLEHCQTLAKEHPFGFDLSSSREHLRLCAQAFSFELTESSRKVDDFIRDHRLPSPPGTFMFPASALRGMETRVREDLLFRIARYISPEPWGNKRAEFWRRQASVERLTVHLLAYETLAKESNASICVGSSVWWRLVRVKPKGVRMGLSLVAAEPDELAWIASRQPPLESELKAENPPQPDVEVDYHLVPVPNWKTHLTVTALKKRARRTPMGNFVDVLHHNRYLVRIDLDRMPQSIMDSNKTLVVSTRNPWFIPYVSVLEGTHSRLVHADVEWPYEWRSIFQYPFQRVTSDWIKVEYIRPLEAI